MPVLSDLIMLRVGQFQIGNEVIALSPIGAAHFFKNRFHRGLLSMVFEPAVMKMLENTQFSSFPITACPFTTNEPQSCCIRDFEIPLYNIHIRATALGKWRPSDRQRA